MYARQWVGSKERGQGITPTFAFFSFLAVDFSALRSSFVVVSIAWVRKIPFLSTYTKVRIRRKEKSKI